MDINSFDLSFISLLQGGVPIKTIIDIGCADGQFGLKLKCLFRSQGDTRELNVLNIDANNIFEDSLQEIESKLGIPYRITALSAFEGKLRLGSSNLDDPYNLTISGAVNANPLEGSQRDINCTTLDNLLEEINMPEPFFIKMDVENAEFSVLQGAEKTLKNTAAILIEQHVNENYVGKRTPGDFLDKCNYLGSRNFTLFDIREISYRKVPIETSNIQLNLDTSPHVLTTFYPVFLNREYDFRYVPITNKESEKEKLETGQRLIQRRKNITEHNRQLIENYIQLSK